MQLGWQGNNNNNNNVHAAKKEQLGLQGNNNTNVHLSFAPQCPERSHDTYQPKYDILYTVTYSHIPSRDRKAAHGHRANV